MIFGSHRRYLTPYLNPRWRAFLRRIMQFEYTSHGAAKAITWLESIGELTEDILRRDGWEIVGYANKLYNVRNRKNL